MNKTELYTAMTTDLETIKSNNKIPAKAIEALEAMLVTYIKPKTSSIKHPPLENGDLYCRYTQKYYPEAEMVMSKGKSKGYSKVGIALWNKAQRTLQKWSMQYADIEDITGTEARELGAKIKGLKAIANDPEAFKDGSLAEMVQ